MIDAWKTIVQYLKLNANKVNNSDNSMCILCGSLSHESLSAEKEECTKSTNMSHLYTNKTLSLLTLNEFEEASLREVCLSMTSEVLHEVLQNILKDMVR